MLRASASLQLGSLRIDLAELRIIGPRSPGGGAHAPAGDQPLTPLEGKLIEHLLVHRGRTVPREQLLTEVWGYSPRSVTRAVDNTVSRLRRKIEPDPAHPRWLVSTRGGGYRLEAEEAPQRGVGNLPAARDSFVGRERELAELARQLGQDRLITLTGPGGTGKTRLALEAARRVGDRFAGGAWVADLTAAVGRDEVLQAVAGALHVPLRGGDPSIQLGAALAYRGALLLVLDNCEPALDAVAELVSAWLDRAPDLTVLATSREPLRLRGEVRRRVDPLPLPPDNREPDRDAVRDSEAVELFVQRGAAAAPGFAPDETDLVDLARVARLLDGLPLALELAAAQVDRFTLHELAQGLQERLDSLTSAERDRPDRHRTLTAALDWSWQRLAPEERAVLAQLSVFAGEFDAEAAVAVVSAQGVDVPVVLRLLEERSLVRRRLGATGTWRLGLLGTVRTWAAEKLGPGEARALEERHGRYYARFGAEEAMRALRLAGGVERQRVLVLELDNLLAACRRAIARGDPAQAVAPFEAAFSVLVRNGPLELAAELARAILALPGLTGADLGRAERSAGLACDRLGRTDEATIHYEAALTAARAAGHVGLEAAALGNLAVLSYRRGELDRAEALYASVRALARQAGDDTMYATTSTNLGHVYSARGDFDRARAAHEEALAIHRALGDRHNEGHVALQLGIVHAEQGRFDQADDLFEVALAAAREAGDRWTEAMVLGNLGQLQADRGDLADAIERLTGAMQLHSELGDQRSVCMVRASLAQVHLDQGAPDRAVTELEAAIAGGRETRDEPRVGKWLGDLGHVHARAGHRAEAERCFAEGEEILRRLGFSVLVARVLVYRIEALRSWGELDAAREVLAEAERIAADAGNGPDSPLGRQLAALGAMLRTRAQ